MTAATLKRSLRSRKTPAQASHGPSLLHSFDWRRPFDALWGLFSSVRLAIILVSSLLVVCVLGMLIPQAPAEVTSSPTDYLGWLAVDAHAQFGQFTSVMNWLQFFTIFGSWYFKVLIVLLALNILVGGMLNRAPTIWRNFRHPLLRRAEGFYRNSPVRIGLTVGQDQPTTPVAVAGLQSFLRKRGFRTQTAPSSDEQVTYLYVYKHNWAALSTFVFHTCLILTMLCAVLTGWSGFGTYSMASRILPGPIFHYFQNLAGFSYNQPLPDGSDGVVYPLGTDHNIRYRAKQFVAVFDPVRQVPIDFYTDLQIFQDGKLVKQQRIRVNDPLTYQGVTFHQASFMMYTDLRLRDAQGNVLYSGPIPLLEHQSVPDPNSGNVLQTNQAENVQISTLGEAMNVVALYEGAGDWLILVGGNDQQNAPIFKGAIVVNQDTPGTALGCAGPNNQPTAPSTYGCQLSNGWWLQENDLRRGTVLLITKDAGSPLLWPTLALLVLSLWITFAFPPRRIWMRIEGDQVRMAALKEHFVNLQRDLDSFARALGNRPLRQETTH